jgi:hypothetical protein
VKIFSHIALSTLLLLTASGVTINMHFCKGYLYDLALNIPAHNCCIDDDNICHHDQDQAETHHCDDKTIKIKATDDFLVSGFYPDFENYHSDDIFLETQIQVEKRGADDKADPRLFNFKSPPPTQDVVLSQIQSFLF